MPAIKTTGVFTGTMTGVWNDGEFEAGVEVFTPAKQVLVHPNGTYPVGGVWTGSIANRGVIPVGKTFDFPKQVYGALSGTPMGKDADVIVEFIDGYNVHRTYRYANFISGGGAADYLAADFKTIISVQVVESGTTVPLATGDLQLDETAIFGLKYPLAWSGTIAAGISNAPVWAGEYRVATKKIATIPATFSTPTGGVGDERGFVDLTAAGIDDTMTIYLHYPVVRLDRNDRAF